MKTRLRKWRKLWGGPHPRGLIETIPEIKVLIGELNRLMADHANHFSTLKTFEGQAGWINKNLSQKSSYAFSSLPNNIQRQLLVDRDPHGNVQVSRMKPKNSSLKWWRAGEGA